MPDTGNNSAQKNTGNVVSAPKAQRSLVTWRYLISDIHRRLGIFPCIFLLWLGLTALSAVQAETLKLATGEFHPYVGKALPDYGLSSQIVRSAFQAVGYQTTLVFMPWRRVAAETAAGLYAGSYPWAMNDERKLQFLYSQPIYRDQIHFFARSDSPLRDEQQWFGKTLCIPDGWDIKQLQQQIEHYRLRLNRPSDIENCLLMVEAGRVDLTAVNRMVGDSLAKELHLGHGIGPVGNAITTDLNYFIVSRTHPQASKLIEDFNRGLETIRQNGSYERILQDSESTENRTAQP